MKTNPDGTHIYVRGEEVHCPHCGKAPDAMSPLVEDFAIPGRTGEASMASTECTECDKWFNAIENADGTFTVRKGRYS